MWTLRPTPTHGQAVATDSQGNVYSTGYFTGTVDFDPGPGTVLLSSFGGSEDVFVTKVDPAGNLVWAKVYGGAGADRFVVMGEVDTLEAALQIIKDIKAGVDVIEFG